jgi:O-antigen/teichoic acid export membrane protein
MFSNPGVTQALIQKRGDVRPYLDSAFVVQLTRGVLLSLVVLIAAPAGAYFARTPEAIPIVRSIAVILLLRSLTNPAVVHLQREMDFKREIRWRLAGSTTGLIIAVAGAIVFRNVWSMVASLIAAQFMQVVASYLVVPYRPGLRADLARIRELLWFGKWIFLSHILMFFKQQADALVVGRLFGAFQLGLYQIGTTIALVVTCAIGNQVSGVALPAFARMRHVSADGVVRSTGGAYLRLLQTLCLLLVPVSCAMTLFAEPLVTLIMGPKWTASAPIIRLAVWTGLGVALTTVTNGVFIGVGRPQLPMWISLGRSIAMLILMGLLRKEGPAGIALGVMLSALGAMACSVLLAIRIHGLSLREVARSSRLVLFASAPVLVVFFAIGRTMPVVAALATVLALAMAGLLLISSLRRELASGNRR